MSAAERVALYWSKDALLRLREPAARSATPKEKSQPYDLEVIDGGCLLYRLKSASNLKMTDD